MFSPLHMYRWHPTWIKVPLMLLCRRRQHCQDDDHSDREHSQGCQGHESSNTPGYLSGVRLMTKGIPVAEKKAFRTTSPIKKKRKKSPLKTPRSTIRPQIISLHKHIYIFTCTHTALPPDCIAHRPAIAIDNSTLGQILLFQSTSRVSQSFVSQQFQCQIQKWAKSPRGASTKPYNKGHFHRLICFSLWHQNATIQ